jgi:hypothetical protein
MDTNRDEHTRAGFLIERYPPGTTIDQVNASAERLASAVELIRDTGVAITYVGAVWVPDDDTVFDALVADSTETVHDALQRAGTPVDRINHAYFVTPATTPASPPSKRSRNPSTTTRSAGPDRPRRQTQPRRTR